MVAWRTITFVSYVVFYERFSPSVDRTRPDSQNVHLTQMGCTGQNSEQFHLLVVGWGGRDVCKTYIHWEINSLEEERNLSVGGWVGGG